jgi:hypothetical protein
MIVVHDQDVMHSVYGTKDCYDVRMLSEMPD